MEARLAEVGEPVETRRNGALQIWLPADCRARSTWSRWIRRAAASDGDFAAMQVIELESGMQCAELQQRLGPLELARVAAELAREYGGAMIAVERNNHGAGVLAYLDSAERYADVYEQSGVAGWLTIGGQQAGDDQPDGRAAGRVAGDVLQPAAAGGVPDVCHAWPAGATGAANGAHDDCLMAMAIAQAVRAEMREEDEPAGRASARRRHFVAVPFGGKSMASVGRQRSIRPTETGPRHDRYTRHEVTALRAGARPAGHGVYSVAEVFGLAVLAVQAIRRMRGGAQSQLMLGADGKLWVVKFQNNPQHLRVLANELIATRLAAAVGLTVPASDVVEVTEWLVANTLDMQVELAAAVAQTVHRRAAVRVAVCRRADAGAGGGLSAGAAVGRGAQPGGVCRDAVHR